MKYFAEIDNKNVVKRVVVVSDDKSDQWLEEIFGGNWIETSPTGGSRRNFAGAGMQYSPKDDAFMPKKPADSWVFDEATYSWKPPKKMPSDGQNYNWNEELLDWEKLPPVE